MAINDPRTSQRYMPRFEVWMNVFIHYAFTNVVNSLSMLETMTLAEKGAMLTGMKAPIDKLVGNVLILEAHIIGLWREKDQEFADASKTFHESIQEQDPSVMRMLEVATQFYHEIIELMRRRGMLRFKPPRSLAAPTE